MRSFPAALLHNVMGLFWFGLSSSCQIICLTDLQANFITLDDDKLDMDELDPATRDQIMQKNEKVLYQKLSMNMLSVVIPLGGCWWASMVLWKLRVRNNCFELA